MSKESYYFSHDANARNDEKILMLRAEHGWEGYGVYWMLIEMMFESSETKLSIKKLKGIAVNNNIAITVLQDVINTCITEELFETDEEFFWSNSLLKRKSKLIDLKKSRSEAGKKAMEKRWAKKESAENIEVNNTVITELYQKDNTPITNYNKGKETKGKEIKENKQTTEEKVVVDDVVLSAALKELEGRDDIRNKKAYALKMIADGWQPVKQETKKQFKGFPPEVVALWEEYERNGCMTDKQRGSLALHREFIANGGVYEGDNK